MGGKEREDKEKSQKMNKKGGDSPHLKESGKHLCVGMRKIS